MISPKDELLIEAYYSDELNSEEKKELLHRIKQDPALKEAFELEHKIINDIQKAGRIDLKNKLNNIHAENSQLLEQEVLTENPNEPSRIVQLYKPLLALAAILTLFFVGQFLFNSPDEYISKSIEQVGNAHQNKGYAGTAKQEIVFSFSDNEQVQASYRFTKDSLYLINTKNDKDWQIVHLYHKEESISLEKYYLFNGNDYFELKTNLVARLNKEQNPTILNILKAK